MSSHTPKPLGTPMKESDKYRCPLEPNKNNGPVAPKPDRK